ncbi:RAMP superfamily CRISPR-associated protein [Enterococcus faecalis]
MHKISLTITTKSNLLIGGAPASFEIGGIDQYTVMDYAGNPYIPGSSLKGVLRNIVRNLKDTEPTSRLAAIYQIYCEQLYLQACEKQLKHVEDERKQRLLEKVEQLTKTAASATYLFGIEGFNQTPKVLISDFILADGQVKQLFSIDSKNKVESKTLTATPRTYKTVAPNVVFKGEILFQNAHVLENSAAFFETSKAILEECCSLINDGYYRLGNSGSRGYGIVNISMGDNANDQH